MSRSPIRTAPRTAFLASLAAAGSLLAAASTASAAVVVNEVESQGAVDFVELANTDGAAVDIGNYVLRDGGGNSFTIPAGNDDPGQRVLPRRRPRLRPGRQRRGAAVRPRRPRQRAGRLRVDHSRARHLRPLPRRHRPDEVDQQRDPRRGERLPRPSGPASPWPGGGAVSIADSGSAADNLSGLAYQPSGTAPRACCGRCATIRPSCTGTSPTARSGRLTRPTAGPRQAAALHQRGGRAGRRGRDARRRRPERGLRGERA